MHVSIRSLVNICVRILYIQAFICMLAPTCELLSRICHYIVYSSKSNTVTLDLHIIHASARVHCVNRSLAANRQYY